MALTKLCRKKSNVNCAQLEKMRRLTEKNSGINGGEPEKNGVNGVELEK